jgi:predicted O-linked N-acetylglucosamine transferase (SPINDLY family)
MATVTVPQAMQFARQCLEGGRLADAESVLRQVLAKEPRNADALHLLGVVAHRAGRNDVAVDLIGKAILLDPISAHYRNSQGVARHALGQIDEAVAEFRCALQIDPGLVQAHNNLGNALRARGLSADAAGSYREALRRQPDYVEARNNLGNALKELGDPAAAATEYRAVLTTLPDSAPVHNNLGTALADLGELKAAVTEFQAAIALSPIFPQAHFNLGNTLRQLGQLSAAATAYRGAILAQPDAAAAHHFLGATLRELGEVEPAVAACREAVRLQPDLAEAHNSLGNILQETGQIEAAIASYRTALGLRPGFADAQNNLGNALKEQGDLDGALECYRAAIALDPTASELHSNLVYGLQFSIHADERTLREEQACWSQRHATSLMEKIRPHANDRDSGRRLKVGYVSPDFYAQAECYFVLPLLEAHDRSAFEICLYADARRQDEVTARYRQCADVWCDTLGMSDEEVAARIRADGIDILVDLTMHMRNNRLPVFARKPAPVQVSWLAYPGSTGLPTIDYRLTDAIIEPPQEDEAEQAERAVRLPACWCCYKAVGGAPEVSPLPAFAAGHLTFGSLNHPCKINASVLLRWVGILAAVPGSQLLLLSPEGAARERVIGILQTHGVATERVEFVPMQSRPDYLRLYARIDIGLDPFPYNGITTTCDALWMGVPVLTVPGKMPASRVGASLLTAAGLPELVAPSEEGYVSLAAHLANDLPRLAELRADLRDRMRASTLTDASRFAAGVEAAYRAMCLTGQRR